MAKEKWYSDGLRFKCTQCGNCCSGAPGYVWVTRKEIQQIAEYLGRDDGWLTERELRRVGFRYSLTELADGDCIFLERRDGRITCLIHPVRPTQCRNWPFWNSNLKSRAAWDQAAENCPGMNKGAKYDFVQIETRRNAKAP